MPTLVTVAARALPVLARRRCTHVCTGKFRVNANGRRIDVWLIYRCANCGKKLNVTIHSRVRPESIALVRYEHNDPELVRRHAFDPGVPIVQPEVRVSTTDARDLVFALLDPVKLRLDRAVALATGLSRTCVRKLLVNGKPRAIVRDGMRASLLVDLRADHALAGSGAHHDVDLTGDGRDPLEAVGALAEHADGLLGLVLRDGRNRNAGEG